MHVMAGDHTYVSNINILLTLFLYVCGRFSPINSLYRWLWCFAVGWWHHPFENKSVWFRGSFWQKSHRFVVFFFFVLFYCQLIPWKGQNNDLIRLLKTSQPPPGASEGLGSGCWLYLCLGFGFSVIKGLELVFDSVAAAMTSEGRQYKVELLNRIL